MRAFPASRRRAGRGGRAMSVRRFWLVARHELAFNARRPMFYICLLAVRA